MVEGSDGASAGYGAMRGRLRVLTVIGSADVGGAEVHVEHVARHVSAEHAVVALSDGPMIERYRRAGAETVVLDAPGKMPLKAVPELARLVARFSPDVVHTHTPKANLLGALAGIRAPRIMTIHGSHRQFASSRAIPAAWYAWADLWASRGASRVVAVCEADRRELIGKGFNSSRTVVVRNGVPDAFGDRAHRPDAARDVVWIGRFSAEKDPREMVSIARLVAGHPGIGRIRMIGAGPLADELSNEGLPCLVIEPLKESLSDVFGSALALVNTSRSEGASLTILEALSAGVPVVASAVGGTPEIVGGAGVMVARDRPDDDRQALFAGALKRLAEDEAFRLDCARAARARYRESFTIEAMASALESMYRNADAPPAAVARREE